jgi:hypothetical protein
VVSIATLLPPHASFLARPPFVALPDLLPTSRSEARPSMPAEHTCASAAPFQFAAVRLASGARSPNHALSHGGGSHRDFGRVCLEATFGVWMGLAAMRLTGLGVRATMR